MIEAEELVGPELTVVPTLVGVPVFSGMSVELALRPSGPVSADAVLGVLKAGGVTTPERAGVRFLPRPRRVEGKPFPEVARVRVGDDGTVHLWAAMDNLRAAATAAVGTAGLLLR